ncbi:MAG: DAK2 domain-containing protein [Caldilineaceae bacterium]|nr:DAK2 domain-containing protein [Caldilineaceae bacterium]
MSETIKAQAVVDALTSVATMLETQRDYLTSLDQAMGDGDMGITLAKIGTALKAYATETPVNDDIGQWLAKAGMAANKAGPSTMGTLVATALMRAGKEVKGKSSLTDEDLAAMFTAADTGMQERGKAKPGDKTIIDAIHPAAAAFSAAVADNAPLAEAGRDALTAAKAGRDSVTPLRSKVGRASWVGERTEGKVDAGCEMFVLVMETLVD